MSTEDTIQLRGKAEDDIEFLVSSWNRLEVLEAITRGPRTRNELKARVDISRVTLSRILGDLEARDWILRQNEHYEATNTGLIVAAELTRLVQNFQTLNQLDDHLDWIRTDQFDFDLRHLRDADIITPTWDDFAVETRTLVELITKSSKIRGITTGLDREFFHAISEATMHNDVELELLLSPDVVDKIPTETDLSRLFHDIADSPHAMVYRYEGEEPVMMLGIHDITESAEVAMMCGYHEEGAPPGTLKSTNPVVRSWAAEYFEERKHESVAIEAEAFTP